MGDRTCAGSADSTIFAATAPAGAYTYSAGLYSTSPTEALTPYKAVRDDNFGAQTMVDGLHAVLTKNVPGESKFVYTIVADDSPIAGWDFAGLGLDADYVVWMHGSREYGTAEADYAAGLRRLVAQYPEARIVFVEPGNGSAVFAARTAAEEYSIPSFSVEDAMIDVARAGGAVVLNPLGVEYGTDGRTPVASSMSRLGTMIGKALTAENVVPFNPGCVARGNLIRITGMTTSMLDTINIAPARSMGFEVWRGTGRNARRLNLEPYNEANAIVFKVNEPIVAGDRLVYGTTDVGSGPMNGRRGNFALDGVAMPHFSLEITDVEYPDANVTGTITCDGAGVAGVTVSDGYAFAVTDNAGRYALASNKKNGYVFYTLPSGYEPETEDNGWQIRNYAHLAAPGDVSAVETHDFALRRVDNDNHIMVVGADAHLAARTGDKKQFKNGFVAKMKALRAANPDARIYSTILGDLTWDEFWYSNNYALPDFVKTMTDYGYPFMLFPVMGNHDNNGGTPAGSTCDFDASEPFRTIIAPTYYSYNLGKCTMSYSTTSYIKTPRPKAKATQPALSATATTASTTPTNSSSGCATTLTTSSTSRHPSSFACISKTGRCRPTDNSPSTQTSTTVPAKHLPASCPISTT